MPTPRTDPAASIARAGFGALRRAEQLLVEAFAFGEIARVTLRRPELGRPEVSVRAALLAWLLRGGLGLRRRRLQLMGAWVEGRLDLGQATIATSLWFYRCRFDAPVLLDGARIDGDLSFAGCHLPALLAERCVIAGDLALNAGCIVTDELRLRRAHVGGDFDAARLDLRGGKAHEAGRRALVADALVVGGELRLADRFQSVGAVDLRGARIGADLVASGHFTGALAPGSRRGPALLAERIQVGGSLRLDGQFGAAGRVSLAQARIEGDLDASGASFDRLGDAAWSADAVLSLDRARIGGALVLRALQQPLVAASFAGARVGTLVDDAGTWGERLVLDGFDYGRFGDDAPLDTRFRIDWLERQEPAHLHKQFRLQPWRRAMRVLRAMGLERRAGSLALRREARWRRAGRVGDGLPAALRWGARAGHAALGVLAGHGHRPERPLLWLAFAWLACALVYGAASAPVAAGPVPALAFSLDRLLPLLRLDAARAFVAEPAWAETVRWLGRAQAVSGAALIALWVASVAGWMDRDRRR